MNTVINKILSQEVPKEFYKAALDEVIENRVDEPTFAKAMANSAGTKEATRSLYIKYRALELHEARKIHERDIERRKREEEKTKPRFSKQDPIVTAEQLRADSFIRRYPNVNIIGDSLRRTFLRRYVSGEDVDSELSALLKTKETELRNALNREHRKLLIALGVSVVACIILVIIGKIRQGG